MDHPVGGDRDVPPDGRCSVWLDIHGLSWLDVAMKTVRIAELKDHLSQHLRAVEAGDEIVVTDRHRPIARIVPVAASLPRIVFIQPRRDFAEVRDRRRPRVDLGISSTELLLEERGQR